MGPPVTGASAVQAAPWQGARQGPPGSHAHRRGCTLGTRGKAGSPTLTTPLSALSCRGDPDIQRGGVSLEEPRPSHTQPCTLKEAQAGRHVTGVRRGLLGVTRFCLGHRDF